MPRLLLLVLVVAASLVPVAPAAAGSLRGDLGRLARQAGPASGVEVVDLGTGRTLVARRATTRRVPASVQKLLTSVATLMRFGADGRLATRVLGDGELDARGTWRGDLYLRGGGDPALRGEDLRALARDLEAAGVRRVRGRVLGDETAWDARRGGPESGFRISPYVGPLSAVAVDRGLTRGGYQADPPAYAAATLTAVLRQAGVEVSGRAGAGATPEGATELAVLRSAPLAALLRLMNVPSDNFVAEMLIKALGATATRPGTHAAGARGVRLRLRRLGLRPQVRDGSGLSRANRVSPREVVRLLAAAHAEPVLWEPLHASLAVAGRSGTLSTRMRGTAAARRCRAKTGTLSNVSALAGVCRTRGGRLVAFAILMNGVDVASARRLQDRIAIRIARQG